MKYGRKESKTLLGGLVLLAAFALVPQAESCVQPPVSWWPGDGNANDIADVNNGTFMPIATFAAGLVGQAFMLNGMDAFVNLHNDPSLHVSGGDFTVDAWVNFNSLSGDMSIVDKMSSGSSGVANSDGWRLLKAGQDHLPQANNRFWFCLGGVDEANGCSDRDSHTTVISTTEAQTDTWYHVAAVKTSSKIKIYVNGVLEGETVLQPTTTAPGFTDTNRADADLLIGSSVQASRAGAFLHGRVDEVEIYDRALTDEIPGIVKAGPAGNCSVAIDIEPGLVQPGHEETKTGVSTAARTVTPSAGLTGSQIRVAILGSADFDPSDTFAGVEVTSLTFETTGNEVSLVSCASSSEDVNGDPFPDLVCDTQVAGFQGGDTRGVLKGRTRSAPGRPSRPLRGTDSVPGQLYLAAISTKPDVAVSHNPRVTGLGLTWTLVGAQCSGRDQTRVEVWMAQGRPTMNDMVIAHLESTPKSAAIAVSRYSGVAAATPTCPMCAIGSVVSGNTIGFGAVVSGKTTGVTACSHGVDSATYSLPLTTTVDGAVVYGAVAKRQRAHRPGSERSAGKTFVYVERADIRRAGGGNSAGVAVEDRVVHSASNVAVNGSFVDGTVDWAAVAVEIMPR